MTPDQAVPRSFKYFAGKCFAVVLSRRSPNDPHICITLTVGDDDNWFVANGVDFSSFWLPEVIGLMNEALDWLKKNAELDYSYDGTPDGWKLKETKKKRASKKTPKKIPTRRGRKAPVKQSQGGIRRTRH